MQKYSVSHQQQKTQSLHQTVDDQEKSHSILKGKQSLRQRQNFDQIILTQKNFANKQVSIKINQKFLNLQKPKKRWYKRKGYWSLQQKARYYIFLKYHIDHFVTVEQRKRSKIFKQMAEFITSRKPNQCRSHHQKQQLKYRSMNDLMINLYEQTKQHPILTNQPPFQKQMSLKSDLLFQKQQFFSQHYQQQHDVRKSQKKKRVMQMPQTIEMISEIKYRELFGNYQFHYFH